MMLNDKQRRKLERIARQQDIPVDEALRVCVDNAPETTPKRTIKEAKKVEIKPPSSSSVPPVTTAPPSQYAQLLHIYGIKTKDGRSLVTWSKHQIQEMMTRVKNGNVFNGNSEFQRAVARGDVQIKALQDVKGRFEAITQCAHWTAKLEHDHQPVWQGSKNWLNMREKIVDKSQGDKS